MADTALLMSAVVETSTHAQAAFPIKKTATNGCRNALNQMPVFLISGKKKQNLEIFLGQKIKYHLPASAETSQS